MSRNGLRESASSLVDLLESTAASRAQDIGYTFITDGDTAEERMSYGELARRARAIAALLQSRGLAGERALLLYPPGLDYIAALFGCLYAGVVAVPAYPPQSERHLPRIVAIASDARASVVLTTRFIREVLAQRQQQEPTLAAMSWLATDDCAPGLEDSWKRPALDQETLAFLQYTSGSTSTPKGVMLSHGNLLANSALIHRAFAHSEQSRGVIWLPPYHDMGLIGGILQPLYGGFPTVLMSPVAYLQRPMRWLEAISRYGGTTSGGPNFAYDLCVRRSTPEQRARIDLSSWRVAFNGAEPIRPETLNRFAAAFADAGFRPEAFHPCYGLAEATLIVTGGRVGLPPVVEPFLTRELEQNRVVAGGADLGGSRALVGSGEALGAQRVAIVDPQTLVASAPGQVGEVWVAGPSISDGYWNRPEESARSLKARLADTGEGPFLRTGDLGFLRDGQLFITGRIKELMIIRGRNHYPQDIELSVEKSDPALRPGCGAAFTIQSGGEERLVVVHEVDRRARDVDVGRVVAAVRRAVADEHELQVHAVVLVKHGSLLKTSSGKIQRQAMRGAYLSRQLQAVGSDTLETAAPVSRASVDRQALLAAAPEARAPLLSADLQVRLAALLHLDPSRLDVERPLNTFGLDSLGAVELQHTVESELGASLPLADILRGPSIVELTRDILAQLDATISTGPALLAGSAGDESALSYGQRAIWFLQQLAPENTAYHIARAARVRTQLDLPGLERALRRLVERHASLRTTFEVRAATQEPYQVVHAKGAADLRAVDAAGWSESELHAYLDREVHLPFNLAEGPLLRLRVLRCSETESVLLLVLHHIITDFWSLAILVRELSALYLAEQAGTPARLAPPALTPGDHASWQLDQLKSPEGERLWSYWQRQLAGAPPALNLPMSRSRPPIQTYVGAVHRVKLSAAMTSRIKALSERSGVTLYVTLLAAFQTLLHRYTGQDDVLVGSPTAGRGRAKLANLMGYLVNLVALRTRFGDNPTFSALLQQVHQTVLAAFSHQEYPFALLAERLLPQRDPSRSPLVQVMFSLQRSPHGSPAGLAGFAVGESGARIELEGLPLEAVALEQRSAQFDLTLVMAEVSEQLVASFEYNADLLDGASVAAMAEHFVALLQGVVENPSQPIATLPLLTDGERAAQLTDWNATQREYPAACIHQLFEAQAARAPEAPALVFGQTELSYAELNRRANRLARYLQSLDVGPGVPVGICMERSVDLMVGLLAILKTGGAYLPLDPNYPRERLAFMVEDAQIPVLLTQERLVDRVRPSEGRPTRVVAVDSGSAGVPQAIAAQSAEDLSAAVGPDDLAYIIYTSGSTGKSKGVQLKHRGVINFFVGMDERIGCGPRDALLAVTSVSFDISVLELFWTLARGAKVVLLSEHAAIAGGGSSGSRPAPTRSMQFSLFYFASSDRDEAGDKYRLLLDGARYADQHGFTAVWTPERHFHAFGGLYPNPAITSAALATITERIQLRGGSVVMPLHHPLRVAEEWSVVDNLSRGRVGIAFASGWHSDDFAFFPERFHDRKQHTVDGISAVQKLWRGEAMSVTGGAGKPIDVRVYPKPVQATLPVWVTAGGTPDTFKKAGELGAGVLTHLLGQSIEELAGKIALYRQSLAEHGHDPRSGHVSLMMHTFIHDDLATVREKVRVPFTQYLRSSVDLISNLIKSLNLPLDLKTMSEQDLNTLLGHAFDRYFETSALFGTPSTCQAMVDRLKEIGVDEIACLVDFGVDVDAALKGLEKIDELRRREVAAPHPAEAPAAEPFDGSLAAQARRHRATLLQCTPSMMRMLSLAPENVEALQSLRVLMLGGEALPPALAKQLKATLPARLVNMYGPTETTIWSATHEVTDVGKNIPIGRPIANTQLHVLDGHLQPRPIGVPGELYIGGDGLAVGYLNRPELTEERFISTASTRLYRTGDLARRLPDGSVEFLGRVDHQVKLRGYRIELEEIEVVLGAHPDVREVVVVAHEETPSGSSQPETRLLAYVVKKTRSAPGGAEAATTAFRAFLREKLPEYMVPSAFLLLESLPHTSNGKIDRKALPPPGALAGRGHGARGNYVAPTSKMEQGISAIWREALNLPQVGIHDNFFDLGGHSLLMAQVHRRIREELKVELPLVKLLEHPTISSLARYLGNDSRGQRSFQQSQERAMKQLEKMRRHPPRAKG